jgi:hypothetical protein
MTCLVRSEKEETGWVENAFFPKSSLPTPPSSLSLPRLLPPSVFPTLLSRFLTLRSSSHALTARASIGRPLSAPGRRSTNARARSERLNGPLWFSLVISIALLTVRKIHCVHGAPGRTAQDRSGAYRERPAPSTLRLQLDENGGRIGNPVRRGMAMKV